jgi:hypothetical protein
MKSWTLKRKLGCGMTEATINTKERISDVTFNVFEY